VPERTDQRRESRLEINTPVTVRAGDDAPQAGRLTNLSAGGAMVQLKNPTSMMMEMGQPVELTIEWSSPSRVHVESEMLTGYVRHVGQQMRMGVQFEQQRNPGA